MVSAADLLTATDAPLGYQCRTALNLYSSPDLTSLATQAIAGRQLRILSSPQGAEAIAVPVCLVEDDYPGWLALEDLPRLESVETPYEAIAPSATAIQTQMPAVVTILLNWMNRPNRYLWGGTAGPNYDCSGLMQAAFMTLGIWLPRDAYQQASFTRTALSQTWLADLPPTGVPEDWFQPLQLGDLIFFGTPERITHVGFYLGDRYYLHSSGESQGRNGIGIDRLTSDENSISSAYYAQLRGAGRVTQSYQPTGQPQWRSRP